MKTTAALSKCTMPFTPPPRRLTHVGTCPRMSTVGSSAGISTTRLFCPSAPTHPPSSAAMTPSHPYTHTQPDPPTSCVHPPHPTQSNPARPLLTRHSPIPLPPLDSLAFARPALKRSVMLLALAVPVAVAVVGQEKVLVQAVAREGDDGGAEARQRVAETVPPREAACVAPGFTVGFVLLG